MSGRFFTEALTQAGGLVGTERVPLDLAGGGSEWASAQQVQGFVISGLQVGHYAADSTNTDFTASVGEMAGAELCVLDLTGALAAGKAVTTPSAAGLIGGSPTASWVLRVVNRSSGAFSWTLTAGSGVTITGTATVAQNTWREWLVVAASGAVGMQNIGAGTV